MALTFLGTPVLSHASLPFVVICLGLHSSFKPESWYSITEEERKRKSWVTPNSSWGKPEKFRVKSNHCRVALSPVLHADCSDPSVLTLGLHGQRKWQFGISVKMGEGCPRCVAIKANKGIFCRVLFFQTFFG